MIEIDTLEELQNEWRNPYLQWWAAGMPSFETLNLEPWRQLTVNFKTREDRQKFAELFGYEITDKTNVVWYPEKERERNNMNRYVDDSEV
jgi:hypothetical protein